MASYTKDTVHFLNKLPKSINENEILATFDVVSLYSNITHELGLRALSFWLEKCPQDTGKFSKKFILEATALVLKNNYFEFQEKNYLQIMGTAMGTKMAPAYANLVLGYLEVKLKEKIQEKTNIETANNIMNQYIRYLDDIFIIWNKMNGDINVFRIWLSELDPQLNFTLDQNGSTVTFLDVKVYTVDSKISTDIFYKKTDSRQYLDYKSCHPRHIKNNIPYNLARRICTIVSDDQRLKIRLSELKSYLKKCNYPESVIMNGIEKAMQIPKEKLRAEKEKDNSTIEKIPFISTFNPNIENNFQVAKSVTNFLKRNPATSGVFKNMEIINSRRQAKNLKDILTRAKFTKEENIIKKVTKCNAKTCFLCKNIITGSVFKFTSGEIISINENMNCNTLNCVYVLQCCSCLKTYIGETSDLRKRINIHRDHSSKNSGLNVSRHLYNCASKLDIKFRIMPIYKVREDNTHLRRLKEKAFIDKFKPELNSV